MAYLSREARREQIVNAVVEIVSREGLAAATVRRIAREIECSPGQIHHHFASADALRAEAVREVWRRLEPSLIAALNLHTPRERILIILAGGAELPEEIRPIMQVTERLWKEAWDICHEPAVRDAVAEGIGKMCDEIIVTLRKGVDAGQFPADINVKKVAMGLIAASTGFDLLTEVGAMDELGGDKITFIEDLMKKERL